MPIGASRVSRRRRRLPDAIPDSAIYHWPFDERGDGTVTELLEGEDGTAQGTTNISNNWWEGYAERGDGSDDDIAVSELPALASLFESNFAFAITLVSADDSNHIAGNAASPRILTGGSAADTSNKFAIQLTDSDANQFTIESSTDVFTGDKIRVAGWMENGWNSNSDEVHFYVNGSKETAIIITDESPSGAPSSLGDNFHFFSATEQQYTDADLDNPIVYENPTENELEDDYNIQPWS